IPVYAGCPRSIGGSSITAEHAHGDTGLGELELPPPQIPAQPAHGVDFLIGALRTAPRRSVTICALGPLTNIATALVKAPDIAERMAELVVMGGASYALGNTTPCAEFNIHADPTAAAIAFASGAPLTLVPLDLTHQVMSTTERIERLRAAGNRCGEAAAVL